MDDVFPHPLSNQIPKYGTPVHMSFPISKAIRCIKLICKTARALIYVSLLEMPVLYLRIYFWCKKYNAGAYLLRETPPSSLHESPR